MKDNNLIYLGLRRAFLLSAVLFPVLFVSCKKEGVLTPAYNSSQFELKDTVLILSTATIEGDSLKAYDQLLGSYTSNVLGELKDDIYGNVKADIYTRMYMSTQYIDPPSAIEVVDSMVMLIGWRGFYGFTSEFDITVSELGEALNPDQDYYTNDSVPVKQTLGIGSLKVSETDTFPDSVFVTRIRLNDDLGTRILEKRKFEDQAAWLDFFKGIHISAKLKNPTTRSGAIAYVVPTTPSFRMMLFFHDVKGDAYGYPFYAVSTEDELGTRFSTFKNDYADALNEKLHKNTEPYDFLGTLSGPRVNVHINNMQALAEMSPLSINKAELIIPYEDPTIPQYEPSYGIFIRQQYEDGSYGNLPDYRSVGDDDYFDGYLNEASKEYRFNIARTMNSVINKGQTDLKMILITRGSAVTANRFSINSGVHPTRPMYILMTYTKQL